VCVFVVHVIVYGFYSLFLSHPVLHCMYRPITFLLWIFVSIVFRCLCFLLFIVSPRPLLLFCVFCFAEYRAFSGPPWLWHSPIGRYYPRKTTEESRAHVEPSIAVFSHRPVRLKVVCQSWWYVAFTPLIPVTGLPWQVNRLLNRNAAVQIFPSYHSHSNYVPDIHRTGNLIARFKPYVCKINYCRYLKESSSLHSLCTL